jgi:hypothetical protein
VQCRIARGDDSAAFRRFAAVPGGDFAARALDDRYQRDDIMRL